MTNEELEAMGVDTAALPGMGIIDKEQLKAGVEGARRFNKTICPGYYPTPEEGKKWAEMGELFNIFLGEKE